jgi:hypothetical protein
LHVTYGCARNVCPFIFYAALRYRRGRVFGLNHRNPQGIHKAICDRIHDDRFEFPPDKPLTLTVYTAGSEIVA